MSDWREKAACLGADVEDFYPTQNGLDAAKAVAHAKRAYCFRCPVIQQCGLYAIAEGEQYGIWGGMSEKERRRIIRGVAARKAAQGA